MKVGIYSAFVLLGILAGYLYWNYFGCLNGCAITSVWYRSSLYGGFLGYLVAGMLHDPIAVFLRSKLFGK